LAGLPDFSLFYPNGENTYTKLQLNYQNGLKIYQLAVKYSKWPWNIVPTFSFQGPPKFTQVWIFGLKTYHLATPGVSRKPEVRFGG
jgi:hypothetical protein